ncbi:ribonuclease P protein component [Cognatiluteimonas weifangensis]|uniref:ribonuclease P protein component n=1 Tax=Cognatiluteimonas weifangensis TaxID=2303539 RepID=UPI001F293F43
MRARTEFDRVFAQGRRIASPQLALHWLRDGQLPRLGLAVSRKVDPTAVGRNRIKRSLREQFRQSRAALAPGAYVVVARAPATQTSNRELRAVFDALLQRAGALPPPETPGTMPAPDSRDRPSSPSLPRPGTG